VPAKLLPVLVIDTAAETGQTLRKAARRTGAPDQAVSTLAVYVEPPRVRFWYEEPFVRPYLAIKRETVARTAKMPANDPSLLDHDSQDEINPELC